MDSKISQQSIFFFIGKESMPVDDEEIQKVLKQTLSRHSQCG